MARRILPVVAGVAVAFLLVAVIEAAGHLLYPPPPGLDFNDHEQVKSFIANLPVQAFLVVLAAWSMATLGGGVVACWVARERPWRYAIVIGVVVLAATVANLLMIPHPGWMAFSAVVAIIVMTILAARIGEKITGLGGAQRQA